MEDEARARLQFVFDAQAASAIGPTRILSKTDILWQVRGCHERETVR